MAWLTTAALSVAFVEVVGEIGNGGENRAIAPAMTVKKALFQKLLLPLHRRAALHFLARLRLSNVVQINQVPLHALMAIYPLLFEGIIPHIVR